MALHKQSTVVGVFNDPSQAQQAVRELKQAGYREDQIGVVSQDKSTASTVKGEEKGSHVTEGALAGVATGAGVGALWALGIAANILPGIGPVVSGGIFASLLASAAGGAAIAGVAGALVGLGIPEEEAHYYEGELKSGRTIVTVKADGRTDEAWAILHRQGAYNKQNMSAAATATATSATSSTSTRGTAARTSGEQTMQLHEEQLHANTVPVKTGEVHVRKEVVTENKTLHVPVTHEEVVIERRPASGHASSGQIREGEEVRIPLTEERVHVSKETVAREEVSVGKRKVTDTETVSGSVRKEQVKVEKEGDATVHGDTTGRKGHK